MSATSAMRRTVRISSTASRAADTGAVLVARPKSFRISSTPSTSVTSRLTALDGAAAGRSQRPLTQMWATSGIWSEEDFH